MLRAKRILLVAALLLAFASSAMAADSCPAGQLKFTFKNLKVREGFAIFADFAGLKPDIDPSIDYTTPWSFDCTPWETAARQLADRFNLDMKIEKGVLRVRRKS